MPPRPHKPCRKAGCKNLQQNRNGYCDDHQELAIEKEEVRVAAARKSADEKRGNSAQRGYGEKWRKERIAYLRENPLCVECMGVGQFIPAMVVDHIVPHRMDMKLFWRRSNWQALCVRHHAIKTAKGQ
jgi:5-methylcytosine-specific restriction enzyme A